MAILKKKQSPLRAALDNERGRDYKLEKQRKQEKAAAKRKSAVQPRQDTNLQDEEAWIEESEDGEETQPNVELSSGSVSDDEGPAGQSLADQIKKLASAARRMDPDRDGRGSREEGEDVEEEDDDDEDSDRESGEETNGMGALNGDSAPAEDEDDDQQNREEEDEDEEDIPLSDIDSQISADDDVVPHQRLTINNATALRTSLARIALPIATMPFSAHISVTGTAPTAIPDVDDDLNRELSLYAQSLAAVRTARPLLAAEGTLFSRPADYFAEMVKSDAHMGKIRARLVDDAARTKASQDARRTREAKKFGKAVQQERLKERAAAKREMLDKVSSLKRKRKAEGAPGAGEDKLFDVALEDAAESERREKAERRQRGAPGRGRDAEPNHKRQKKNEKYGFGGKKKHSKSNDAVSTGDMRGFPSKRGKPGAGRGGRKIGGAKRPGKNRRANMKA